jgi:hypothetical protein
VRSERIWTPWKGRRIALVTFATKQHPLALFHCKAQCYQVARGNTSAGIALTLFGVGFDLSTYCRTL